MQRIDDSNNAELGLGAPSELLVYPAELPAELWAELVRYFDFDESLCLQCVERFLADSPWQSAGFNMHQSFSVGSVGKVTRNFLRGKGLGWSELEISARCGAMLRAALSVRPAGTEPRVPSATTASGDPSGVEVNDGY
jgi:hypothetical protein